MTGLQAGRAFSEIVLEAKALGYTEPDPRDDLGGVDVARKALILARGARCKLLATPLTLPTQSPGYLPAAPPPLQPAPPATDTPAPPCLFSSRRRHTR